MVTLDECSVCGSKHMALDYEGRSIRRLEDTSTWRVFRCEGCGFGFINPQPTWEDLAPYYDQTYEPYSPSHGLSEESDDEIVARASRSGEFRHVKIQPCMRILDVGAGGGHSCGLPPSLVPKWLVSNQVPLPPSESVRRACRCSVVLLSSTSHRWMPRLCMTLLRPTTYSNTYQTLSRPCEPCWGYLPMMVSSGLQSPMPSASSRDP